MRSIVLGLFVVLCGRVAHASDFAIYGPGNESCATFATEPSAMTKGLDMEWVMGFMTAMGEWEAATNGPLIKTDTKAMQMWLDHYCRAHPLDEFHTAVEALTRTLYQRAIKHRQ